MRSSTRDANDFHAIGATAAAPASSLDGFAAPRTSPLSFGSVITRVQVSGPGPAPADLVAPSLPLKPLSDVRPSPEKHRDPKKAFSETSSSSHSAQQKHDPKTPFTSFAPATLDNPLVSPPDPATRFAIPATSNIASQQSYAIAKTSDLGQRQEPKNIPISKSGESGSSERAMLIPLIIGFFFPALSLFMVVSAWLISLTTAQLQRWVRIVFSITIGLLVLDFIINSASGAFSPLGETGGLARFFCFALSIFCIVLLILRRGRPSDRDQPPSVPPQQYSSTRDFRSRQK